MPSRRAILRCCLALALSAVVPAATPAAEGFAAYRTARADGAYFDWFEGRAGIMGRAVKYQDLKMKPYIAAAREAATDNARSRLLSYLQGLPLDDGRTLGNEADLVAKTRELLEATEPAKVEVDLPWTVKVMLMVPLYGERSILGLVLPPAPAPDGSAASTVDATQTETPAQPAKTRTVDWPETSEEVTGLVIDATHVSDLGPALLPRVVDTAGRLVHGLETADPEAARQHGLAAYALRIETNERIDRSAGARKMPPPPPPREGARPMRVTATAAGGPRRMQVVVSVADADRILKEAAKGSFLKACRVVILMPPGGGPVVPAAPARPAPARAASPGPAKPR